MTLKDNIISDLDILFNEDEFGETAEYNGDKFPVIFITKSEYLLDNGFLGTSPAIVTKKVFGDKIKIGEFIIYKNTTWYITKKEFKDEFVIKLYISKEPSTKF